VAGFVAMSLPMHPYPPATEIQHTIPSRSVSMPLHKTHQVFHVLPIHSTNHPNKLLARPDPAAFRSSKPSRPKLKKFIGSCLPILPSYPAYPEKGGFREINGYFLLRHFDAKASFSVS